MRAMKLYRNIRLGIKTLTLHKLRSFLTMLGVVFGVASVVAMLAVGEGASREALDQIRKLGSTNIIITSMKPVEEESRGTVSPFSMSVYGLLYADEQRAAQALRSIKRTVPVKLVRKEGRLGERKLDMRIVGTTPDWFDLVQRDVIAGRVISPRDAQRHAGVVVLTEYGARRLLATARSLGETLRIGGEYYEVIGIVRSESGQGGAIQTPDQEIDAYIPIEVARERYGDMTVIITSGSMLREMVELHQLIVEVDAIQNVEATAAGLERMLKQFHPKVDYRFSVPLALLRQAEATKRTFNVVLGSIAGISLLVGGIGIMNIMLASVTERTREIGIRRAIGAKRAQIIVQFLIETMVLSTTGGFFGVAIGLAIPWLITRIVGMPTVVTGYSLALAVGISVTVGLIFGLYPARHAANLDPIEALRHE
ncbi:MAG TPA: ABC transporter permease [Phycisphaerae bacterium]|nr:ABC transporter permease [Phycisphaerae bacterium]